MNIWSHITSIFSREEPDFKHTQFEKFEDSLQNFLVFYPKHWEFEKTTAVVEGAYTIVFNSTKSETTLKITVETRLPYGFDYKRFLKSSKDEIEKPSAGVISEACKGKFKGYYCMSTDYIYSKGNTKFRGEKILFYTGDRIFTIFFICPLSQYDKLKKVFEYVKESFIIKPQKMMIV